MNLEDKLKEIEIDEKKQSIGFENRRTQIDELKTEIEKITELGRLLEIKVPDSEKTLLGSEPIEKSVFSENEQLKIKSKIFEIINKF